jgi:hypothetical protein
MVDLPVVKIHYDAVGWQNRRGSVVDREGKVPGMSIVVGERGKYCKIDLKKIHLQA